MGELITTSLLPLPALPTITTRVATMDDLAFVDALQKKHSKQLGFFPRAQIEGYVKNGWMRIAEDAGARVGYIASRDRYQKRDELGAVFQLCVEPGRQRGLIGATLLKSAFDHAAYGCRLFCCWCAQDLAANRFWESMGFVPLAFRAGSEKKSRVHIFWQKRIRADDVTTPWWFPSGTGGGAIREDRLVLPIPPGTHWSEVKAMGGGQWAVGSEEQKVLPAPRSRRSSLPTAHGTLPTSRQFGPPPSTPPIAPEPVVKVAKAKPPKRKVDAKVASAARELRDRWLEQVNASPMLSVGKYDVARQIAGDVVDGEIVETKLLAA